MYTIDPFIIKLMFTATVIQRELRKPTLRAEISSPNFKAVKGALFGSALLWSLTIALNVYLLGNHQTILSSCAKAICIRDTSKAIVTQKNFD